MTGFYFQGVTAVVHGYSVHALDPILGEFTLAGGGVALGVNQCLVNTTLMLPLSTLQSTLMVRTQTNIFLCMFYYK